jgi:DNA processing protein
MTTHDAVVLALLGATRRRWLSAVVRNWLGRPLPDIDDLPARRPEETLVAWACRTAPVETPDEAPPVLALRAERVLAEAIRCGHAAIGLGDSAYPPLLAQIPDPPPVLWVRGDVQALSWPRMVAVVGARAATLPGRTLAADLAAELVGAGVVVVSGLARGIDSAAHQAAIDAGGATVAVLGSGLDRIYPSEHRGLAAAVAGQGALVTEHLLGTSPLPYHFPLRNRIISGLSSAVVVVEASEKSGSLITAMAAAEQGREVMAVPGPVGPGRHRGGHALLRDGATLVEGADDVLVELGWKAAGPASAGIRQTLTPEIARELGLDPMADDFSADEVAVATGWTVARVNARLAALEVEGCIQRIGGGRFQGTRTRVLR